MPSALDYRLASLHPRLSDWTGLLLLLLLSGCATCPPCTNNGNWDYKRTETPTDGITREVYEVYVPQP